VNQSTVHLRFPCFDCRGADGELPSPDAIPFTFTAALEPPVHEPDISLLEAKPKFEVLKKQLESLGQTAVLEKWNEQPPTDLQLRKTVQLVSYQIRYSINKNIIMRI
jgi:hypothetical protein